MTTTAEPATTLTTYTVKDFIDATALRADLAYSTNDLSSAMMNQSSFLVHYGVLAAQASHQVDVVKMLLESTEAAVYKMIRAQALKDGEKTTEAQLEKKVALDKNVVGMKRALNEAKRVEAIGKTAVEAFRHRRDMLIQQGLLSREEMKGEVSIALRDAKQVSMESQKNSVLKAMQERSGTEQ